MKEIGTVFYKNIISPVAALDGEWAHHRVMDLLEITGRLPPMITDRIAKEFAIPNNHEPIKAMGIEFNWPGIIMAEGFVKRIKGLRGIQALGANGVALGTFTLEARKGNPLRRKNEIEGVKKHFKRVERDPKTGIINNWMNFPNAGIAEEMERFDKERNKCTIPLGVSIVEDPDKALSLEQKAADIAGCMEIVYPHRPDWIAYDPSCPNGIVVERFGDKTETMCASIICLAEARRVLKQEYGYRIPLVVKLSPDMNDRELNKAIEAILAAGIDGVVATNTTIRRSEDYPISRIPQGGLSGPILYPYSLEMVRKIRAIEPNSDKLTIIGCGGIDSAEKIGEMWEGGANLVEVFSGFIHNGPYFFRQLNEDLV